MKERIHLPAFWLLLLVLLNACGGSKPVASSGEATPTGTGEGIEAAAKTARARQMALFMDATRARLGGQSGKAIQLYEACVKDDPKNAAAHFELAKLYSQAQNPTAALDRARKAQALDRDNIWYRFLLADLCLQNGRASEAVEVYRGIIQKWPERHEVYFDLANALARQGKVAEARKVYRELEARFGYSDELVLNEFDLLARNGQLEEARQLLEATVARNPGEPQWKGMLAEVYDELGQHDKALELYQQVLEQDPDNSMVRISLAEHYYGTGDHDKAFEQLHAAFADPDVDIDPKMQLLLGFYEMTRAKGSGDAEQERLLQRAYDLISTMEKAHPESGKPQALRGDFLLRDGHLMEAREAFRAALVKERDKYPIWEQVIRLDLQLNDHASLAADAGAAAELFPNQPALHLYHGIGLTQLKRYDEAIEALIVGRDLVVDDKNLLAQFWSSLGDTYHEAAKHELSDEAYDKALTLDPRNPTTLNNYAYYLSLRNTKLDKAEDMSRRSNELAPDQPSYQDTYAWVLFQQRKYSEARTWIEKALASGGGHEGVIVEHYGDILFRLGDLEGAKTQWKRALELGGASDDIQQKVAEGRLPE
ncbi:MAG: tetratricopeptide repeat protein [Flavobacteriales bacterium]|nr:tetratricopeptide repeat protein [Flavobacteriales bacterium]